MIIVDQTNQSIALTRGDYAAITFCAYVNESTLYDLSEGDIVQLQVGKYGKPQKKWTRRKQDSSATTATDYTIEIPASGEDSTKDMKFGDYQYDVSIITAGGAVYTYIGANGTIEPKFTILKEVGSSTEGDEND